MDRFQTGILRAYEVLKVFGGSSGNRLKALLAFLEPEFAERDGQLLDIPGFIRSVNVNMKLPMTQDAFLDIVPEIVRQGWLEPVRSGLNEIQHVVRCRKPPVAAPSSADALNQLSMQFSAFLDARQVSQKAFPRDEQYLGECLIEWLLSVDTSDELTLASAAKRFDNSADQVEFFCARFVDELITNKSADLRELQLISQVGLLSELVREFKKPLNEVKNTDLMIILDSPLLLELLGASGEAARLAAADLNKRLRSRGARFHYLEGSINELRHALNGMLELPVYERYGPTHAAMQRGEIDEGYVRSVYHNSRELLSKAGVLPLTGDLKARGSSQRIVSRSQVDWLIRDLESVYHAQVASYHRAKHDAEAVATIMRLRGGEFATNDVFRSKFIFLTRNEAFRNTARAFCLRESQQAPALMTDEEVGPVVDIKEMASAIFARMPSEVDDDFSRLSLMAACERVLRLNRKAIAKVSVVVNKMALNGRDNAEAIRRVRVAMLHPGSSLYLQDRLRGEDRTISYEEILREQKSYERDHIDKGIARNRDHYRQQIQEIEQQVAGKEAEIARAKALEEEKNQEIARKEALLADAARRQEEAQRDLDCREAELRAAEQRRAERIIANVDRRMARLRVLIRVVIVLLIAGILLTKLAVEKIWYKSMAIELFGYHIEYWYVFALLLAFALVMVEGAGGLLGDVKLSFVKRWLAGKLTGFRDHDREYDEFAGNRFGLTIEPDGSELRLLENGVEV